MNSLHVDLAKAAEMWGRQFASAAEIFSTSTDLPGGASIVVPTHTLAQSNLRVIPYNDREEPEAGLMAQLIEPGSLAISIKHNSASPNPDPKERAKLQCRHIQIAVGVKDNGGNAVVTLNNPMAYDNGAFTKKDEKNYPMLLIRPRLKAAVSRLLTESEERQYMDNVRTWALIANTFTKFPGNGRYNGNDPLATRSIPDIKVLGGKLVEALLGSDSAKAWLEAPENQVYCAEFAHVSFNLGLYIPLNRSVLGGQVDDVGQALSSRKFLKFNRNVQAKKVGLTMAPENLQPISDRLGFEALAPADGESFGNGLAIEPFTMADMLEEAMKALVPRENLGEEVAPLQAEMLNAARKGLLELTGLNELPVNDAKRASATALFKQLIGVVGKEYENYDAFRSAVNPFMEVAKRMAGPRGDEAGLFIPPHCFLIRATDALEGKNSKGLLTWEYIGHGVHESLVTREASTAQSSK